MSSSFFENNKNICLFSAGWLVASVAFGYIGFRALLHFNEEPDPSEETIILDKKLAILSFLRNPINNNSSESLALSLGHSNHNDGYINLAQATQCIAALCNHFFAHTGIEPSIQDSSVFQISQGRFSQFQSGEEGIAIEHWQMFTEYCLIDVFVGISYDHI